MKPAWIVFRQREPDGGGVDDEWDHWDVVPCMQTFLTYIVHRWNQFSPSHLAIAAVTAQVPPVGAKEHPSATPPDPPIKAHYSIYAAGPH